MNKLSLRGGVSVDSFAFWVVVVLVFLLPLFFLPATSFPFQFTKTALIAFFTLLALALFVVARMKEQKIFVVRNPLVLLSVWLIPLAYFLSALFSSNIRLSLVGHALEVDTLGFMVMMALIFTLTVVLIRSRREIFLFYLAFFASFVLLALYQLLRLFIGPDFLSFGTFTTTTANPVGTWNDLGIFFGLATVISMVTLAGLSASVRIRILLYLSLAISLVFLAAINFTSVWWLVGLFALGTFVHSISSPRPESVESGGEGGAVERKERVWGGNVSFSSLVVLVIAAVFLVAGFGGGGQEGGRGIANYLSERFNIAQIEARPSWQTTVNIARETMREDALFGTGANTFVKQWLLHKPIGINETVFWNVDFNAGIGIIPTSFITTGIVGGIAWVLFLGFLLYLGLKTLVIRPAGDNVSYYLTLSSFLGALYLWTLTIIYTPSATLITFAFLLSAIFFASLRYRTGVAGDERVFSFTDNPRLGFVSVLLLTILFLGGVISIFMLGQKYAAASFYQQSLTEANVRGNIDGAEASVNQALSLGSDDRYHRLAADVGLVRLNNLFQDTNLSAEEIRNQFGQLFNQTVTHAQSAVDADADNYRNWLALQRVYQAVVPLQIEGAYDNAVRAYERAIERNPQSPELEIIRARLELARGDSQSAREFITNALEKKSNYTDAIFLLSQIQINEGAIGEAITSVEAAAFIDPNNPVAFFQLGLLRYSQNDYEGAIAALERAVSLNTDYSNARYFLGLAYNNIGRRADAIVQFERIEELNPDNAEVELILRNLRQGNEPFANTEPPRDDSIRDFEGLPIEGE